MVLKKVCAYVTMLLLGEIMFTEEDKQYLNSPIYSMPLEKFYNGLYYKEKNGRNGTISQAYAFSNERLHNIFKHLRKQNPKVLTVGSSGDQLLYSIYYGSKDVTVIDVNLFSKPWIEYKLSAIKNLSFEEFKKYFLNSDKDQDTNPFCNEVLVKIFQDLSVDSQSFWGTIYTCGYTKEEIYSTLLERKDCGLNRTFSVFYKDKTAYNKLQKILKENDFNITFINEEFSQFHKIIEGKFDIILLSNIRRYVGDVTYIQNVNNLYNKHLNKGGIIQLHYDYCNVLGKQNPKFKALFPNKKISGYGFKDHHYTYLMHKPRQIEEELSAE